MENRPQRTNISLRKGNRSNSLISDYWHKGACTLAIFMAIFWTIFEFGVAANKIANLKVDYSGNSSALKLLKTRHVYNRSGVVKFILAVRK